VLESTTTRLTEKILYLGPFLGVIPKDKPYYRNYHQTVHFKW
jgi:hypothetical protein